MNTSKPNINKIGTSVDIAKADVNSSKQSLDSILRKLLGHDDPVEIGNGYHDDCAEEIAEAKQAIVEAVEGHFQKIVPEEGPFEDTKGTFADGYAKAVKDVCDAHYKAIKEWQNHGE